VHHAKNEVYAYTGIKNPFGNSGKVQKVSKRPDPDFNRDFAQIVQENGFIFESHPVTTSDGYKLNVFRIRSS